MRTTRFTVVVWILIAAFLYASVGDFLRWQYEWKQVRSEIKHQLKETVPTEKLHRFEITSEMYNQLDWVKPEKEFRLNHQMFDVVKAEHQNERIILHCINDKEEAALFKDLNALISRHFEDEQQSPDASHKFKYLKKDWHIVKPLLHIPIVQITSIEEDLFRDLPIAYSAVSEPPPKV